MEDKIKYYVDLLNAEQDKISKLDQSIIDYELLILKEKTEYYKLSLLTRIFSGRKKLLKELNTTLSDLKVTRYRNNESIKVVRNEMLSVGKLLVKNDLNVVKDASIENVNRVLNNITTVISMVHSVNHILEDIKNKIYKGHYLDKHGSYHAGTPDFESGYNDLLMSVGRLNKIYNLIEIDDYLFIENMTSKTINDCKSLKANLASTFSQITKFKEQELPKYADSNVLRKREDLYYGILGISQSLYSILLNDQKIYNEFIKSETGKKEIEDISHDKYVLNMIREQYGLNIFWLKLL